MLSRLKSINPFKGIPNLLQLGREYGALILGKFVQGLGATKPGNWLVQKSGQIHDERMATEELNRQIEQQKAERKSESTAIQAESIKGKASAKTQSFTIEEETKVELIGEEQTRKEVAKTAELKADRKIKSTSNVIKTKLLEHSSNLHQDVLKTRKEIGEIRLKSLKEEDKIVDKIITIQKETKPLLKEVIAKTKEMMGKEIDITKGVEEIAKYFLDQIKIIHSHELGTVKARNDTSVQNAITAYTMDVIRYQSTLAIELARHHAELEKTRAERLTEKDKELATKLVNKEIELENKIKKYNLVQTIFSKELDTNLEINEKTEIARHMSNLLKAKSFERIEEFREDHTGKTNHAVQQAAFFAKNARNNEASTIEALKNYVTEENPIRRSQIALNNMYLVENPELSTQPEMIKTSANAATMKFTS